MIRTDGAAIVIVPDEAGSASVLDWVRAPVFARIASPLAILIVWEVLVRLQVLDARFVPAPSSVVMDLIGMISSGEIFAHVVVTAARVAVGFFCGALAGIALGLLLGLSAVLRSSLQPVFAAIYPVPKVALFPLIMMIFGIGETSKYVIVALAVFFQVFFSTLAGVMNIDRVYIDVAANFKATSWQRYWTVAWPGALPYIFTGLQLGLGMALITVVIAENFGTRYGVGFIVWRSWGVFEVTDMFVGLILIALLGYLSQIALSTIETVLVPWKGAVARK